MIIIKPYEPIDDNGLLELIITNLLHTSPIDFKFLVLSSFNKFGCKWVALVFVFPIALLAGLLVTVGCSRLISLSISVIMTAMALFLVYGLILPPIRTQNLIDAYVKYVFPRLKDIKKNYMEKEGAHFWIATQKQEGSSNEKIVGCVRVGPYNWEWDDVKIAKKRELYGKVADFGQMSVSSEIRRQGLGKKLLNKVLDFARAHDYDNIVMSTSASNLAADTFYRKAGFKRIGKGYYDESWFPAMCYYYAMSLKN